MKHDFPLEERPLSRRQAIIGGTTAVLGAGVLAMFASRPTVAAEVTVNSLSVSDRNVNQADGSLEAVFIRAGGTYEYVSQDIEPDSIRLDLLVSPDVDPGNFDRLDRVEQAAFGFDDLGTFELLGEVTAHGGFDPADWDAPTGGTQTAVPVRVRVVFSVLSGTEVIAEAVADDTATLTVSNTSVAISLGVDATGAFEVVADPGDPTPAP